MRWPATRGRGWRPRATAGWAVSLSVLVTLAFGIIVWIVPTPPPYVFITLETELLDYHVAREVLAGVFVEDATYTGQLDCQPARAPDGKLSGLLQPAAGSTVTYRWRPEGVAITVGRAAGRLARFTFPDEESCQFTGDSATIVLRGAGVSDLRLPIAGRAESGSENSAATASTAPRGMIHAGEVTVFGRTLLGRELYPVANATYPIPPGSRLASGQSFVSVRPEDGGAAWYGAARVGERGLLVSATTDTTRLLLYRPGLGEQTESFSFGLLTRIFNDPSLGLLTLSLGVFFLVSGAMMAFMSLAGQRR